MEKYTVPGRRRPSLPCEVPQACFLHPKDGLGHGDTRVDVVTYLIFDHVPDMGKEVA
jgi:hypothetical protein